MTWAELIDLLSAQAGIEPFYFDIRGHRHETSLATKVLTLEALGIGVPSIPAAAASLHARESSPWRRWLAPFTTVRAEHPAIDLFLPTDQTGRPWTWELLFEHGETAAGEFRPETLPLLGMREWDGRRFEHRRLELGQGFPLGYHRLRIAHEQAVEGELACVPARCYLPPALERGQRLWGVSAHLYTVKSERDAGIGDFGDLASLAALVGQAGASALVLNPFHGLFPSRPEEASPYSPSSRLFLNPIYIDLPSPGETVAPLRASSLVTYREVWRAKRAALDASLRAFREQGPSPLADAFAQFSEEQGGLLQQFAAFCALEEEYGAEWPRMRERFPAPDAPAVAQFAREHSERVALHVYAQFIADRQLRQAAEEARRAGLDVGLVRDLAMGINPDGFDAWADAAYYAKDLRCGAPPDDFQPLGQEWGILPLNPLRLHDDPAPFLALLRANMRHAGGLRMDHIIGLQRQFLVPAGAASSEGCYVRYPLDDLLGLLALESHRHSCMVIGEDLGTVPEGFRARMHESDIFGFELLYFERRADGAFKPPRDYRVKAAASVSTHDLATLSGFWLGRDGNLRRDLGIYSEADFERASAERGRDRERLIQVLIEWGFLAEGTSAAEAFSDTIRNAVHAFLASSRAQLFLTQIDDLLNETEQINVPGTTNSYPNWRRKLSRNIEDPDFATALHELAGICAGQGRHRRPL